MLGTLTANDFRPRVGSAFRLVRPTQAPLPLMLVKVTEHQVLPAGFDRRPFSLEFIAQAPDAAPMQGVYRVEHARGAPLEMFLVPLGPDPATGGMRYEAVFG